MHSNAAALHYDNQQHIRVTGALCASNVQALLAQGKQFLQQANTNELIIDLSEVAYSDSTGLALLLNWLRYAKRQDKTLQFHHVPAKMLSIAQVAGIDKLLPMQAQTS